MSVLGVDDDAEIWRKIYLDENHKVFGFSILIKFLERFDNFDRGKRNFMSTVNATIMKETNKSKYLNRYVLDEGQFMMVFGTMFSDLFSVLGDADEADDLDSTFGAGTWERTERIRRAYREYLVVRRKEKLARRRVAGILAKRNRARAECGGGHGACGRPLVLSR